MVYKKFLSLLLGTLSVLSGYSQIHSKVDERLELVSVMFALGGVPEYCDCQIPSYWEDINKELTQYELSAPINYIRELAQLHAIGYDAAMTAASLLEIRKGRIYLQDKYDISDITTFDKRWNKDLFAKFIKMADKFYTLSNFHRFFINHRELIDSVERQTDQLLDGSVMKWFKSFFKQPDNLAINVYISLANGPHNYSIPDGIVLGLNENMWIESDITTSNALFTLVHEIGHHYTNPLVEAHWSEMKQAAEKIYPCIQNQMAQLAYSGAYTTMVEGLNNLFALMCLKELNNIWYKAEIGRLMHSGFVWTERGVKFLDNFYAHRDRYPCIDDFMPQLISFLNYTADCFDLIIEEHKNSNPRIVDVFPAIGSDIYGFNEVIITFSEPMLGSYGFNGTGSSDPNVHPMYFNDLEWSEDHLKLKIILDTKMIKSDGDYGLELRPRAFKSARYYDLKDECKKIIYNNKAK